MTQKADTSAQLREALDRLDDIEHQVRKIRTALEHIRADIRSDIRSDITKPVITPDPDRPSTTS